jgi:vancomycin permeability regulator SanA
MRYLVAMIFAATFAAVTTVFLATPIASWAVDKMKFDNPDDVSTMHVTIFLGINLFAMLIGWTIGWALGRSLSATPDDD